MGKNSLVHKQLYPQVIDKYLTERLNLYGVRARLASAILHCKAKKCRSPSDYIDLSNEVFSKVPLKYIGWPIKAAQVPFEIESLLKIIKEHKVRRMLEIGSFNGGTLFLFAHIAEPDAKIISLDLPGQRFGLDNEMFSRRLFANFATNNQTIYVLRGNSHSTNSLKVVQTILSEDKLDFAFIDGNHTYQGVKQDYEMYSQLCS